MRRREAKMIGFVNMFVILVKVGVISPYVCVCVRL